MKRNCTFLLFFWQIFLMGSFEISEAWLVIIIIIAIARVVTGGAIQQFLWNALAYYLATYVK